MKEELKTLKDLKEWRVNAISGEKNEVVSYKKLRQEAIKWIKDLRKYKQEFREAHFLEFMDIEEEDLK